jgi:hypothetical protein
MADLDLKGMAQLLRSKGRGRDTVLAHITPREAARLKADGGRGSINPDTGLPEFEDGDFGGYGGAESFGEAAAAMPASQAAEAFAEPDVSGGTYMTAGGSEIVPGGEGAAYGGPGLELLSAPGGGTAAETLAALRSAGQGAETEQAGQAFLEGLRGETIPVSQLTPPPSEQGFFDRLGAGVQKQLQDPAVLARLGLGAGGAGLGFLAQQRGAKQAKGARRELESLAAPYRQRGAELIGAAERGELSPASAQAYQAAQARMAQQQARTGGVGVMQGAANLERLRQQLLTGQYNLGLRVANIGDQYMRGAIQTGMQANAALNQASQQFFTNLAATLAGPAVASMSAAAGGR